LLQGIKGFLTVHYLFTNSIGVTGIALFEERIQTLKDFLNQVLQTVFFPVYPGKRFAWFTPFY
jgi:hypothetical protein